MEEYHAHVQTDVEELQLKFQRAAESMRQFGIIAAKLIKEGILKEEEDAIS